MAPLTLSTISVFSLKTGSSSGGGGAAGGGVSSFDTSAAAARTSGSAGVDDVPRNSSGRSASSAGRERGATSGR